MIKQTRLTFGSALMDGLSGSHQSRWPPGWNNAGALKITITSMQQILSVKKGNVVSGLSGRDGVF